MEKNSDFPIEEIKEKVKTLLDQPSTHIYSGKVRHTGFVEMRKKVRRLDKLMNEAKALIEEINNSKVTIEILES